MWMTIEVTAKYLKVSKETIYRLVQKSDLPGSKLGTQWRFNQVVVDDWLLKKGKVDKKETYIYRMRSPSPWRTD